MVSLKDKALDMRKKGTSIRKIEKHLHIARSTLSYWFQKIVLPQKLKAQLHNRWEQGLVQARKKAVLWHNTQKSLRLVAAKKKAEEVLGKLDTTQSGLLDLALAMLYLGEGSKINGTSMGNSDPLILNFFLTALERNYSLNRHQLKCELHLRADQDPVKIIGYWSEQLKIPIANFRKPIHDARTLGRKTYLDYKGVCVIQCGNVAIQRKLIYISNLFCRKVIAGA